MTKRHIKLADGTIWPLDLTDDDSDTIAWKLRYAPNRITKADQSVAAGILSVWALIVDPSAPLDPTIKHIREIRMIISGQRHERPMCPRDPPVQ